LKQLAAYIVASSGIFITSVKFYAHTQDRKIILRKKAYYNIMEQKQIKTVRNRLASIPCTLIMAIFLSCAVMVLIPLFLQNNYASAIVFPEKNAQIAFVSNRDNGNQEIYVMNADGSNQHNISNNAFANYYADWGIHQTTTPLSQPTTTDSTSPIIKANVGGTIRKVFGIQAMLFM
jgi:hypothetical protein